MALYIKTADIQIFYQILPDCYCKVAQSSKIKAIFL